MRIFISLLLAIILVLSVTSYRLYIKSKTIAIEQAENNQSEKSIDEREVDSDAIDTKEEPKAFENKKRKFIAKKAIKNCSQSSETEALCNNLTNGSTLDRCILINSANLGPECEEVTRTLATTLKSFCIADLEKLCPNKETPNEQFECLYINKYDASRGCWLNIGLAFFE